VSVFFNKFSNKLFFGFLLYGFLLIITISVIYSIKNYNDFKESSRQYSFERLSQKDKEINLYYKNLQNILVTTKNIKIFQNYLKKPTDNNKKNVEDLFTFIGDTNKDLMQMRYINLSGMEKIRIDRVHKQDEKSIIIKDAFLQNKKHRYYFKDALKLSKDKFWYSKIDLNIEHQKIEIPHKPTLRIATPVFYNNEKKGILIINIYMQSFLEKLAKDRYADIYLIDSDDFFIIHPNPKFSFNRYLDIKHTLEQEFGRIYKLECSGYNKEKNLFYKHIKTLDGGNLALILKYNTSAFNKHVLYQMKSLAILMVIIFIFSLPITFFFSKYPNMLHYELMDTKKILQEKEIWFKQENSLNKKIISQHNETLYSLIDLIEERDSYTAGHTKRVANYCKKIAIAMELTEKEIELIYKAAMLHDIGKIIIPDSILLKPDKLNKNEYLLMQTHLTKGYEFLKKMKNFKEIAEIMRNHHERYDGKGYPRGTKKDEISYLSHIMIIADSFDAMTSQRIYKTIKNEKEALQELKDNSGTQFHPSIVQYALEVLHVKNDNNTQIPFTKIEKERFSHFFKDSVTHVFNIRYLDYILKNNKNKYKNIVLVYIHNMSNYNKLNGWHKGDSLLLQIAEFLEISFGTDMIFRIYGDDFIVLSKDDLIIDKFLFDADEQFNLAKISFSVNQINLETNTINSLNDFERLI